MVLPCFYAVSCGFVIPWNLLDLPCVLIIKDKVLNLIRIKYILVVEMYLFNNLISNKFVLSMIA